MLVKFVYAFPNSYQAWSKHFLEVDIDAFKYFLVYKTSFDCLRLKGSLSF